ncbi:MAG: hypothetical protein OSB30_03840 [Candidatus Poseidoniaceae archaeon]|nr:hypothetical protein [Candidatus Poseidoniaceae archaeon]
MEGMSYLTVGYLGMILGIAIWTWTVFARSKNLEARISAIETSMGKEYIEADSIALQSTINEEN